MILSLRLHIMCEILSLYKNKTVAWKVKLYINQPLGFGEGTGRVPIKGKKTIIQE